MQLEATSPPSHTVHALHAPRSQPILVPVKPSWSRMTCTSVVAGSTRTVASRSLTDKVRGTAPGPNTRLTVTDEVVSIAIKYPEVIIVRITRSDGAARSRVGRLWFAERVSAPVSRACHGVVTQSPRTGAAALHYLSTKYGTAFPVTRSLRLVRVLPTTRRGYGRRPTIGGTVQN